MCALLVLHRAMDCWHQFTQESRTHKLVHQGLTLLATYRALSNWRHLTRVRRSMGMSFNITLCKQQ